MLTSRLSHFRLAFFAALFVGAGGTHAFADSAVGDTNPHLAPDQLRVEPPATPSQNSAGAAASMALPPARSLPDDPLSLGARAYLSGDVARALPEFERAAENGHALALWKLGRIYADGDGVAADPYRAYQYFAQIANRYADENPHAPQAVVVAEAFVSLGDYYLSGISGTPVRANPTHAMNIFTHAASYFGSSEAQYRLARMYIDGQGIKAQPRAGIKWLALAARNNHPLAQADLGLMLVEGNLVERSLATGLMWMAIASGSSRAPEWLRARYDEVFESVDERSRAEALSMAQAFVEKHGTRR